MKKNLSRYSHPGDGYMYVICDVCGKKVRQKDTVVINDRWNLQNKLVVCLNDVDKANPQLQPFHVREKLLVNPSHIRSEQADQYVVNTVGNRLPSAPRNLVASIDTLTLTDVYLEWLGPEDCGDSAIIGYKITRADPQLSTQFSICDNNNGPLSYLDTTADIAGYYTYQVAAINQFGVGPYSNIAFYPTQIVSSYIQYLVTSDTELVMTLGDGTLIVTDDSA